MKTDRSVRSALAVTALALAYITQMLLLNPPLSYGASDSSEVLKSLAGRWQAVNSRGESSVWMIEADGRYQTVFRPKSGQEVRQTGMISVTSQGSIQSRSDKGVTAVLTIDRDSAGAQVVRGKAGGLLGSTFELRRIDPRLSGTSGQPAAPAGATRPPEPSQSRAEQGGLTVPPAPNSRINDYASVLPDAERQRLEGLLVERERGAKAQMIVALFRSLQGENLEEYTLRVAKQWGVGRALVNDGVVLFIFLEDKKMRLEVGKGLEGVITNEVAATILKDVVAPRLAEGRLGAGIEGAISAVFSQLPAQKVAEVSRDPSQVLRSLAGRWHVVSSNGPTAVQTIEEDGRYEIVWGQSDRRTGRISVTPQGTLQWRSDTIKGANGVFTVGRDASGVVEVIRGRVTGSPETTEARRLDARAAARSEPSDVSAKPRVAESPLEQLRQGGQANTPSIAFTVRSPSGEVRPFRTGPFGSNADVTLRVSTYTTPGVERGCSDRVYHVGMFFNPKYEPPHNTPRVWEQFDLANDDNAKAVFEAGLAHLMVLCPQLKTATAPVTINFAAHPSPFDGRYIRQGSEWKLVEYNNGYSRFKREEEARRARMEEQRRTQEAQQRAAEQEARARREAAMREFKSIIDKHGVRKVVSCSDLSTNPFAFEGEKVALVIDFDRMLERDKAAFGGMSCGVVASGIPARTFSTQQASVVLMGQVIGKTDVKIPLGMISAPHLRFAAAHFCREANCSEFWPR